MKLPENTNDTGRDYLGEMAKIILDAIPEEKDYRAMDVALSIFDKVSATDPELLSGWLGAQAVPLISQQVTERRGYLARSAQRQSSTRFEQAVAAYEDGDTEPLSVFLQCLPVDPSNIVRPIGKMTGQDHLFVSQAAAKRSKTAAFEAAFHAAVASKIPAGKVTEEIFTEIEYLQLRESLAL